MTQQISCLLPIPGVHFNKKEHILQLYMPQRVSLHTILHSGNYQPLRSIEKHLIAKKVAKALFRIQ
jgi:hypothetical protein